MILSIRASSSGVDHDFQNPPKSFSRFGSKQLSPNHCRQQLSQFLQVLREDRRAMQLELVSGRFRQPSLVSQFWQIASIRSGCGSFNALFTIDAMRFFTAPNEFNVIVKQLGEFCPLFR